MRPVGFTLGVASACLGWLGARVVLARVGDLVIVNFGVLAGLGTALGFGWMAALWVGQGLAPVSLAALGLGGALCVVAGSWLGAQLLDYRLLCTRPREALLRPAFVSWGGIAGALLALALFALSSGFDILLLLDGFARGAPLGHAIGRVGCLTYGCCFGRRTACRLSITYTHPYAKAVRVAGLGGVPLHPAPLYEALLHLVLFATLNGVALLGAPLGIPAALCLVGYGLGRFAVERARDNRERMLPIGLALNQALALALAAVGVLAFGTALAIALPAAAPDWARLADLLPAVGGAVLPAALVVGAGFALQRGSVGSW